jgi:hypothetical protein
MRWLVVRFRGRDKTPSIIDWVDSNAHHIDKRHREQRSHYCDRVTTTGDGTAGTAHRERHATGRPQAFRGRARAAERSTNLPVSGGFSEGPTRLMSPVETLIFIALVTVAVALLLA